MKTRLMVITLLVVILTALVACAAPTAAPPPAAPAPTAVPPTKAPEPTKAMAEPTKAAVPTTAAVATKAPEPTKAAAPAMPYGLKPGKPYNGTTVNFLNCCGTATQFFSLNQKVSEFTELTGIKVSEWRGSPYAAFQEEILKETATGGGNYDLLVYVDAWGQGIQNFIQPIDDRVKADNYNIGDFPLVYQIPGKNKKGETMGVPLRGHAFMLFYRKDVFDKLGLKPPTTWAEMEAAAKTIQEKTNLKGLSVYYGLTGGQNLFVWESLTWSNGGDLFDKDWKPIFNSPAGVEATQRYVDWLLKQKIVTEGAKTFGEQDGMNEMVQGRAAMYLGWSWMYSNFTNAKVVAPEALNNIAFVPAPTWEGKGKSATYGHIWEVGILKSSKKQDAAWEYIKWLTNAATEKKVALDKSDPKLDNVVVVHTSNQLDAEINAKHNGLQKMMAESLKDARTQPMMPEWLQIQPILETAVNKMANGAPVKETLDKAAQDVTDLLKREGYYK